MKVRFQQSVLGIESRYVKPSGRIYFLSVLVPPSKNDYLKLYVLKNEY